MFSLQKYDVEAPSASSFFVRLTGGTEYGSALLQKGSAICIEPLKMGGQRAAKLNQFFTLRM